MPESVAIDVMINIVLNDIAAYARQHQMSPREIRAIFETGIAARGVLSNYGISFTELTHQSVDKSDASR
jgi:hypothetical protein